MRTPPFLPFVVMLSDGTRFHVLSDRDGYAVVQIGYQGMTSMPSALAAAVVEGAARGATDLPILSFPPFEPFVRLYRHAMAVGALGMTLTSIGIGTDGLFSFAFWVAGVGVMVWGTVTCDARAGKAREETTDVTHRRTIPATKTEPVKLYKLSGADVLDFQVKEAAYRPEAVDCLQIMLEGGCHAYQHEYLTGRHDVSEETIQYLLMAGLIEVERLDEWDQDEEADGDDPA